MTDQRHRTSGDKIRGVLRILLGLVFFMAGILKVVDPFLGEALSGQLVAAGIPLRGFVLFTFPIVEMVLGILLIFGRYTRLCAMAAAVSMVVATYVHLAVEDPSLFPLQTVQPLRPLVLLVMALYLIWRGGGTWSIDRRNAN